MKAPTGDVAIAAAERHCERAALDATPFNDGVNTVFGVTMETGNDVIVKFGTCDPTAVAAEPFIIERAASFDVPVPTIYGYGRYDEVPYFVAEWLDGTQPPYPMEMASDDLISHATDLGTVLATLQSGSVPVGELQGSENGLVGSGEEWASFYTQHLVTLAEDAKKNYGSLGSDAVRLAHWADVPAVSSPRFCPLDLHTHNLMYREGDVIGVLDFERYYGGHSGWGVAVTKRTLTTNRDDATTERVLDAFNQGYERVQPLPASHPAFELGALLRELRAAHIWWENPSNHRNRFQTTLDDIEAAIALRE